MPLTHVELVVQQPPMLNTRPCAALAAGPRGCSRPDAGNLEGFLAIAAVAQGNDPSLAHREHAVGTTVPAPAVVGFDPGGPYADHDQLARW